MRDSLVWAIGAAQPASNDPDYRFQWALPRVRAPEAWATIKSTKENGMQNVTVCVTDSGVDAAHPDLAANLHPLVGFNAVDNNGVLKDKLKHGTHITGIVAAVSNNDLDIAGVGSDRVSK